MLDVTNSILKRGHGVILFRWLAQVYSMPNAYWLHPQVSLGNFTRESARRKSFERGGSHKRSGMERAYVYPDPSNQSCRCWKGITRHDAGKIREEAGKTEGREMQYGGIVVRTKEGKPVLRSSLRPALCRFVHDMTRPESSFHEAGS